MNRLAEVINRPEPTLAVTFSGLENDETLRAVTDIADVAELRADLMPTNDIGLVIAWAKKLAELPVLLTVRVPEEGGRWGSTENKRLGLFRAVMPHVDGIDIELDASILSEVISTAHGLGKVAIASSHNFEVTPTLAELEAQLDQAQETEADYAKFAVTTQTFEDYQRAAEFTLVHKKPVDTNEPGLIIVGMDALDRYGHMSGFGRRSRISFSWLGSHMTYASAGEAVAPGQMDYRETHERLMQRYPAYAKMFE